MLLEVDRLTVDYKTRTGSVRAVDGVSLGVREAEALGLVGESGCGKSTTAKAVLRLLGDSATVSGSVRFDGEDLLSVGEARLRALRWDEIALVPQTSMNSLDPVYRAGDQLRRAVRTHTRMGKAELEARLAEVCEVVGLAPARLRDYPHQFSGGMRQRLVLAMSLVLRPRLLVADEPTTALDVITQRRVLDRIIEAQRSLGLAVVYVSHDIGVMWRATDRLAVMYAGQVMEQGPTKQVLAAPSHPYTIGLMQSSPSVRASRRVASIPGYPPRLSGPSPGCPFAGRCPFVVDVCRTTRPAVTTTGQGVQVACHRVDEAPRLRVLGKDPATWAGAA
jgi:peptide/nickel transport system ATP-binding protein